MIIDLFQFLWSKQLSTFVSSSFTEHSVFIFLQLREWFLGFAIICFSVFPGFEMVHSRKATMFEQFQGIHKFFWKMRWDLWNQGHPTTLFCKLSFRRRKYHPGFSMTRGGLKIVRWLFNSCTIFKAYLINFLQFSEVWFFTFNTPG